MTDEPTVPGDPQPTKRPMSIVAIQCNPVSRQLVSQKTVVAVVVIHAKTQRLPRQAHILNDLGTIRFDLYAPKPALIPLRPSLVFDVFAISSLIAENHALTGGHNLHQGSAIGLRAWIGFAETEFGAVSKCNFVPLVVVGGDLDPLAVDKVLVYHGVSAVIQIKVYKEDLQHPFCFLCSRIWGKGIDNVYVYVGSRVRCL